MYMDCRASGLTDLNASSLFLTHTNYEAQWALTDHPLINITTVNASGYFEARWGLTLN